MSPRTHDRFRVGKWSTPSAALADRVRRGTATRATHLTLLLSWCTFVEASSCTLISDFDIDQCEQSTECISATGILGRCEQSRCVVAACANNGECIAADPRFPICQRRGGECVALITEGPECSASSNYDSSTMDDLTAEDLILLGAFAPSVRTSTGLSLELAVQELNATGGLPGTYSIRPVLVVECDGSMATAAMHHLVDDLGVHAILGSLDAATLRTVVTQRETLEPAFFLSPGDSYNRPNTSSSNGDYLWYLGTRYDDVVPAYSVLVNAISKVIETAPGRTAPVTIASIASSRDEDEALHLAVFGGLSVDELDGPMLAAEKRFRSFTLPDDAGDGRRAMLELLVQMAPEIVVSFAGGTFGAPARRERTSFLRTLEEIAGATRYAPRYILGPSNVEDAAIARLATESTTFRSRALGLRARRPQDAALRAALDDRFQAAFPDAGELGIHVSAAVYDSLYFLAYAAAAAPLAAGRGRAELTLEGFMRVVAAGEPEVVVGPDGLGAAAEYLSRGTPFSLRGTDGTADFDLDEQARLGQGNLYCWDERGAPREIAALDSAASFILEATPCGPEIADVVAASGAAR
jgi:hypothetical protein